MKMYSADICQDCRNFKALIAERGIADAFENIDITESTSNLRAFLQLWDHEDAFAAVRERGAIGIPCFVQEKGDITLDEDIALGWIGQPTMEKDGCAMCK